MQITAQRSNVSRQENEAAVGLWEFDVLECDALPACSVDSTLAGMALIDPSEFDRVVGDRLHVAYELFNLAAVLCAGRRDMNRQ